MSESTQLHRLRPGQKAPSEEVRRLLTRVLAPDPPPFALLHRPEWTGWDRVEVLAGELRAVDVLADVVTEAVVVSAAARKTEDSAILLRHEGRNVCPF